MKTPFSMLLVIILAVLSFALPAFAQPSPQAEVEPKLCRPVDLVLVIDQSESMSTNDPNSLRLDAAKAVIQNLYYNAAIECENTVTHRIAAVGFGDTPWIMIPLTQIFVEDASQINWEQDMRDLQYALESYSNRREPYTRVGLALVNHPNSAENILESAPLLMDDSVRQRVIILVTDGVPDAPEVRAADRFSAEWVRHYFWGNQRGFEDDGDLFDTPNGLIGEIRNKLSGVDINVIMFSPRPEEDAFGGTGDAWREIVGFSGGVYIPPVDIEGFDDVTASITSMLNDWFGTNIIPVECDQPIYLQPYLSSTTIVTAARPNTTQSIRIVDPTGTVIPQSGRTDVTYAPLETQETYIITNPIPGEWHIEGDPLLCESIQANLSTTSIDTNWNSIPANVPVQVAAPYTTDVSNAYIELYLTDRRANVPIPFAPDTAHPLNICAQIRGPIDRADLDQTYQWPDCITFTQIAEGIWRSDEPVPAPRRGTYSIEITATVKSIIPGEDREIDVFEAPLRATYTTAEPLTAQLQVVSPESGEILPLNELDRNSAAQVNEPVSVIIQPVLQDGTPIAVTDMFYEEIAGELTLQATIQSADGSINETAMLTPSSTDPSLLHATLRSAVSGLDPAGNYTINYTLGNPEGYNTENYALSGLPPATNVERIMLEGVKFEFVNPAESLPRNTLTDDGIIQNQPINFSVRMVNQSGATLDVPTVFGSPPDPLAEAFLRAEDGTLLDSTTLTIDANDPSLFHGTLIDQRDVLGLPDIELQTIGVRFVANALPETQHKRYRLLTDPDEGEITWQQLRFRRHGFSMQTQITNTRDAARLNTIEQGEDGYYQSPVAVTASSCFYDHHDPQRICLNADQVGIVFGSLDEVTLSAELLGSEQELLDTTVMTSNGDGTFSVVLQAASGTETDFIGNAGTHTIRVSLETDSIADNASAVYQPIIASDQASIDRVEVLGVTLGLERLGAEGDIANVGETALGTPDNPQPISLYSSIPEAFGIPLLPVRPQPAEVPVRFILKDTRGNPVAWDMIAKSDVALSDLLQVQITDADSTEPVMMENLTTDMRGGVPVITGGIANANASGGVYTLSYRLNSQYLDTDRIVNLSGAPTTVTFTREITNLLLNPITWIVLESIIDLVILGIAFLLLRGFTFGSMQGRIKVMYTRNVATIVEGDVNLGRKWPRKMQKSVPNITIFDTNGQPVQAILVITVTGNGFLQCTDYDVNIRITGDNENYDEQDLNVLAEDDAQDEGIGCRATFNSWDSGSATI